MTTGLLIALTVYDVAGLVMLAVALRLGTPAVRRDVRVLVWGGVGLFAAAIAAGQVFRGHTGFTAMRFLCHGLACVAAPVMVLRGVWWCRRKSLGWGLLLVVAGLVVDATYLYARRIEPTWLEVTRYEVVTPRLAGHEPIRVVVLADLQTDHVGDYERAVFEAMAEERPDLILMPGDYLQMPRATQAEWRAEQAALHRLFAEMAHDVRLGIWAVDGDVDSASITFAGTEIHSIRDELRTVSEDPPVQILGLSRKGCRQPLTSEQLDQVRAFDGLTIVMGHSPDFAVEMIRTVERDGAAAVSLPMLCVAGHTHGGQVVVPFFGPPVTLSRVPRRYASGLHELGRAHLFVSRGVGHERGYAPRIRFLCRPELAVLTLRGP